MLKYHRMSESHLAASSTPTSNVGEGGSTSLVVLQYKNKSQPCLLFRAHGMFPDEAGCPHVCHARMAQGSDCAAWVPGVLSHLSIAGAKCLLASSSQHEPCPQVLQGTRMFMPALAVGQGSQVVSSGCSNALLGAASTIGRDSPTLIGMPL